MNNKIEIFKLAIKAGEETFSEEQIQFLVECFKKAEQLSTVKPSVKIPVKRNQRTHDQKPPDGHSLFIKQKLSEVKCNGLSYAENRKTACEAWNHLSLEDKKMWHAKVGQKKEKKSCLTEDDLVSGD